MIARGSNDEAEARRHTALLQGMIRHWNITADEYRDAARRRTQVSALMQREADRTHRRLGEALELCDRLIDNLAPGHDMRRDLFQIEWALEALSENYRLELSGVGVDVAIVEPGGFPTAFSDNLMHPTARDRDPGYGDLARAPETSLAHYLGFLAQNPQQDPKLVAEAVARVIAMTPGTRPLRTEVDRIGMGDLARGYNEQLAQITAGLLTAQGMGQMLTLARHEHA